MLTPELKDGINAEINRYRYKKSPFNNVGAWINSSLQEDGNSSVDGALGAILNRMKKNYSTSIIYGNVRWGPAGNHYFSIYGVARCNCDSVEDGAYLFDSTYNSPAYSSTSTVRRNAVGRNFLSENEISRYWKKTGSANPFRRRHLFLVNTHDGI